MREEVFCAEVLQVRRKEIQNRRAGRTPSIAEFRIRVAPLLFLAPLLPLLPNPFPTALAKIGA
jgi:hypothetical protein